MLTSLWTDPFKEFQILVRKRKKGFSPLVSIHHSNIQLQDTIAKKGWRFEKKISLGLRFELGNIGFADQRLDN